MEKVVLGHNLQTEGLRDERKKRGGSIGSRRSEWCGNRSQELGWLTARWVAVPRKCEGHMLAAERMGVVFTHLRLSLKTRFKTSVLG